MKPSVARRVRSHRSEPNYLAAGAVLLVLIVALVVVAIASFRGDFKKEEHLTIESDRAGLVMNKGAKVKLRGVTVGSVDSVEIVNGTAALQLNIDPTSFGDIPANVTAEIKASTAFGAKYVSLIPPKNPHTQSVRSGQRIVSNNVTTEVNTLFENLNGVMNSIDPAKLNLILGAVSGALRDRGAQLGETITDANRFLSQTNPSMDALQNDFKLSAAVTNTYGDAASDLISLLDNATVTSNTIVDEQTNLDAMLVSAIGLGNSGSNLLRASGTSFVDASRLLVPTTALLEEYSPEYKCVADQAAWNLEYGMGRFGGKNNGYSIDLDVALLAGDNGYTYPGNLPKVGAQGGPRGAPGCYSQISATNYPAPYLVMDTGASIADATTLEPGSPLFIQYLFGDAVGGGSR
ncbi:MCE family protein [Williamsia sp. DF01-3]|uniref:MCE family protein n=1 Tax=Williamsia sp. DF01-3 TaxID=2934157 RepID=UPI001FF21DBA|nr:MCE family protein [Williamsia sp. DF01-3]